MAGSIPAAVFRHDGSIQLVTHTHQWPESIDGNGSTECLAGCGEFFEDQPELWGGARTEASAVTVLREVHEALDRRDNPSQVKDFVSEYLMEIGEL